MIIFKIYTLESVQNIQTTSKNFFEGVFSTMSEFAPKKTFVISQKASMNFFEGVFMIIFQNIHSGKGSK